MAPPQSPSALDLINQSPIWVYVLIPFVAAIVGWGTNVVALRMTFYPLEFFGWKLWQPKESPLGLFGWQGIIPTKAGKMAGICAKLMTEKLIDVKEIFGRMDPGTLACVMMPAIEASTQKAVKEVATTEFPAIWESLPESVRQEIYSLALQDAEQFITALMDGLRTDVLKYFDLEALVIRRAVENKDLVVAMFQKIGAKEFRFIEHSGGYFGFAFGIIQMLIYMFYKANWVLPVAGFFVGFATNYLALYVIFKPILPVKFCGMSIQGLFLKRQKEVSVQMAALSKEYYLRAEYMWDEILTGNRSDKFFDLFDSVTSSFIDNKTGSVGKLAAAMLLGPGGYDRVKKQVINTVKEELPNSVLLGCDYMEETVNPEPDIRERMGALPPDQFERVLHPVFEEDEFTLILVGAVLGLIVGAVQVFLYPTSVA